MTESSLTEYERTRLENIRKNQELLASLNIEQFKLSSGIEEQRDQKSKKSRPPKKLPVIASPFVLRGKAPKHSKDLLAIDMFEKQEREKREMREKVKEEQVSLELQSFRLEGINVIDSSDAKIRILPSSSSISNLAYKEDFPLIKLNQARIYSMAWHPNSSQDKYLLFAGDKSGSISVLDLMKYRKTVSNEKVKGIQTFSPVKESISNLKFSPCDSNKLFFSCYDGSIRIMDLQSQTISVVWADTADFVTGIDFDFSGNELYFSLGSGRVGILDLRKPSSRQKDKYNTNLFQIHEKKTQCISTNWKETNYFCTSSLDDTVCIWDCRNLKVSHKNFTTELVPVKKFTHRRSVTSAYFHKYSPSKLITTCYDDYIRLYDDVLHPGTTQPTTIIRHNNQTGKWITTFKATWNDQKTENPSFFIGDMEKSVSIFDGNSGSFIKRLDNEYLTAQPAVNSMHPLVNLMASGTAAGKVCIWS